MPSSMSGRISWMRVMLELCWEWGKPISGVLASAVPVTLYRPPNLPLEGVRRA
jgi:hypothetical protein